MSRIYKSTMEVNVGLKYNKMRYSKTLPRGFLTAELVQQFSFDTASNCFTTDIIIKPDLFLFLEQQYPNITASQYRSAIRRLLVGDANKAKSKQIAPELIVLLDELITSLGKRRWPFQFELDAVRNEKRKQVNNDRSNPSKRKIILENSDMDVWDSLSDYTEHSSVSETSIVSVKKQKDNPVRYIKDMGDLRFPSGATFEDFERIKVLSSDQLGDYIDRFDLYDLTTSYFQKSFPVATPENNPYQLSLQYQFNPDSELEVLQRVVRELFPGHFLLGVPIPHSNVPLFYCDEALFHILRADAAKTFWKHILCNDPIKVLLNSIEKKKVENFGHMVKTRAYSRENFGVKVELCPGIIPTLDCFDSHRAIRVQSRCRPYIRTDPMVYLDGYWLTSCVRNRFWAILASR